jgi:hypothetical protein
MQEHVLSLKPPASTSTPPATCQNLSAVMLAIGRTCNLHLKAHSSLLTPYDLRTMLIRWRWDRWAPLLGRLACIPHDFAKRRWCSRLKWRGSIGMQQIWTWTFFLLEQSAEMKALALLDRPVRSAQLLIGITLMKWRTLSRERCCTGRFRSREQPQSAPALFENTWLSSSSSVLLQWASSWGASSDLSFTDFS